MSSVDEIPSVGIGQAFTTPMFIFLGLFLLIVNLPQVYLLWYINNNIDNSLPFLRDWAIAISVFAGITFIFVIVYLLTRVFSYNIGSIINIWFILLFIVNLIFIGFCFYFLSVVLNSSDTTLRNYVIALTSITGFGLVWIIIALVYYNKYGASRFGLGGSFFGGGASVEDWLRINNDQLYKSKTCRDQYIRYKNEIPYIQRLKDTFGDQIFANRNFRAALAESSGLSPQLVDSLLNPQPVQAPVTAQGGAQIPNVTP